MHTVTVKLTPAEFDLFLALYRETQLRSFSEVIRAAVYELAKGRKVKTSLLKRCYEERACHEPRYRARSRLSGM